MDGWGEERHQATELVVVVVELSSIMQINLLPPFSQWGFVFAR